MAFIQSSHFVLWFDGQNCSVKRLISRLYDASDTLRHGCEYREKALVLSRKVWKTKRPAATGSGRHSADQQQRKVREGSAHQPTPPQRN